MFSADFDTHIRIWKKLHPNPSTFILNYVLLKYDIYPIYGMNFGIILINS